LARLDLLEIQVDSHRLGHRLGVRLPDEQAAVQPAAHLGQAVVLEQPDRLAEDRPADPVAGNQLYLTAKQLPRFPALPYNRLLDLVSNYLCLLQMSYVLARSGNNRGGTGRIVQQGASHTLTAQVTLCGRLYTERETFFHPANGRSRCSFWRRLTCGAPHRDPAVSCPPRAAPAPRWRPARPRSLCSRSPARPSI